METNQIIITITPAADGSFNTKFNYTGDIPVGDAIVAMDRHCAVLKAGMFNIIESWGIPVIDAEQMEKITRITITQLFNTITHDRPDNCFPD